MNLEYTMAKFILPRLKRYKALCPSHPVQFTKEQWDERLDDMILAFQTICDIKEYPYSEAESQVIQYGLKLFSDNYMYLWF